MKGTLRRIELSPIKTNEETAAFAGTHLKQNDCKLLITENADLFCKESGICIAKFRKNVISKPIQKPAYDNLFNVAKQDQDNRGTASGRDEEKVMDVVRKENAQGYQREENSLRFKLIIQDGTISKTSRAVPVKSNIIGYMDSTPRFPYCRQTAFNQKHFEKFKKAYPIIKTVDNYYKELMPRNYERQYKAAQTVPHEFIIKNTVFSTVTVNMDWQTAVHQDRGDFTGGFGNLVALRSGNFTGGHFVIVKWGVGFDLQNGDLLLADVHQWHGNTPIIKQDPKARRISLVMYLRENMMKCDSVSIELEKAQIVANKTLNG